MDLVTTQDGSTVQLFAGDFPRVTKGITLAIGAGLLTKGTVLGKITKGAVTSAAKSGGNTGDGTCTVDATTPKLAGAKAGIYKVRVVRAAIAQIGTTPVVPAQKAIAELKDPSGNVLEVFDVPTTPGITISNQVKFALIEGSTAFVVGDGFDITIAAGSGYYLQYDDDNVDGSEIADAVLAEDAEDATSAIKKTVAYTAGYFNSAALTGYDAAAGVDFEKSAIFIGSVL